MPVMVNGSPVAHIPVTDRGFQFGDGLFETARFAGKSIPLWPYHRARLEKGLAVLGLEADLPSIESDLAQLLSQQDARAGVVRITVTRGDSQGSYAVRPGAVRRVLETRSLPAAMDAGVTIRLCDWRLAQQPALAGIKHLNRLDQVMARREWDDPAIFDGLMRDDRGDIVESTCCNLFVRHGTQWSTPDLSQCGVAGVMRSWLLCEGFPDAGHDVAITRLTLSALLHADEVFLCNSVRGIVPVMQLLAPECRWQAGMTSLQLRERVGALWHG